MVVGLAPFADSPAYTQDLTERTRPLPRPLPSHPGNIFLAGEEVVITLPPDWAGAWELFDYEGRSIGRGDGSRKVHLGKLPAGYYEIPRTNGLPPIGIAVLTPLSAPTPKTSPIGVDTAAPWEFRDKGQELGNLCALAGINWVRGRLSWPELEPSRGQFAGPNPYDTAAREMNRAGLQLLQVNHRTPQWAGAKSRFPDDLRDAYGFYREMARRWKGQVQAFEPWNEADWTLFGGHTGAEMASLQKACYWGLKAGNTNIIVCQNVFASYHSNVVADFHDNQAWPYFDTLNFHHYQAMEGLPKYYESFRQISGGRPMWVTECNFYASKWGGGVGADLKTSEFTPEGLRLQAAQVLQIFALSIQGGSEATFWFMFGNFHESTGPKAGPPMVTQFGVIRKDFSPRPSYLALAAAGRLLADAKPVGQLKSSNPNLQGYLFRAQPDGKEQLVLVAWSKKEDATLQLPATPTRLFDIIGREQPPSESALKLSHMPTVSLFPVALENQFVFAPAPTRPPKAEGKPSPLVFQAAWPIEKSTGKGLPSNYKVSTDAPERMPVYLYNFGDKEAKGRLSVTGPKEWNLAIPAEVSIKPMERVELSLTCDLRQSSVKTCQPVKIEGDFETMGRSIISLRLLPVPPEKP